MRHERGGLERAEWWVTDGQKPPVGPVSTELLLRGIESDRVPRGALVCLVGGKEWTLVAETAPFASVFAAGVSQGRNTATELSGLDVRDTEPPRMDSQRPLTRLAEFQEERTVVEAPRFASDSTAANAPYDGIADELTSVDAPSGRTSGHR